MQTRPIAPRPLSSLRGYDKSEPGYALTGYLYHVEAAILTCDQALEWAQSRAGTPAQDVLWLLHTDFVNCHERYSPYIDKWHVEMVETGKRLRILPEICPLLERMRVSLESLWDSGVEVEWTSSPQPADASRPRSVPTDPG